MAMFMSEPHNFTLALTPVSPSRRPQLWALLQQYLGELAQYYHDQPDENGCYPYPWLDSYFSDPERAALFLEADEETAGFALINRFSAIGEAPDHAMAEFFLLPERRRKGLGLAFARELFRQHPGSWEIKYHRGNPAARGLWDKATAPYSPKSTALGEETVLSFTVNKEVLL